MQNVPSFEENALGVAASPYLLSHQDNPVWWQQWSAEVLDHARREDKPLLVSVGYSTCHWCHVMAREAFSDQRCADAINRDFVAVKVDREERPDIDQHLMNFLVTTTGQGGWPLNAFLTPELKPFFAMTYASVEPRFGMPAFVDILQQIIAFYRENRDRLRLAVFRPGISGRPVGEGQPDSRTVEGQLEENDRVLISRFDRQSGGLTGTQKFPPHTSLLYALHRMESPTHAERLKPLVRQTLDAMQTRGLHDHLAGGIFRYTVDANWTIPHFEKMLYDQALCLWNYSVAARRFDSRPYRDTALGVIGCLENDFLEAGLFNAAIDADTAHEEGATYLWQFEELRRVLNAAQLQALSRAFEISEQGNFEGQNHLVGRANLTAELSATAGRRPAELESALQALLAVRRSRPQPFTDRKKLTLWNALTGIALLTAERHLDSETAGRLARTQLDALLDQHVRRAEVLHGTLDGRPFAGRFLADYASMLLLLTYHHEDHRNLAAEIRPLRDAVLTFLGTGAGDQKAPATGGAADQQDGSWREANEPDFIPVIAEPMDSPLPASDALAEIALARSAMVLGEEYRQIRPGRAAVEDFRNLGALMTAGYCVWVTGPQPVAWRQLPLFSVQGEGAVQQYCYAGSCVRGLPPHEVTAR